MRIHHSTKHSLGKGHGAMHRAIAYMVRSGDTLTAIADRYGTTVSALARRNHLADPNYLYVGERLEIRGAGGHASARRPSPPERPSPPAPPRLPTGLGTARRIAGFFTGFTHVLYNTTIQEGVANAGATLSRRWGNCSELAAVAVREFQASGTPAREVWGWLNWGTGADGHVWDQYYNRRSGQWSFFDPTAAAVTKNPSAALNPALTGWSYTPYGVAYV